MKKPVVLAIDDDTWQLDEYSRLLGNAGYKTVHASNALEAISQIDAVHPDMIILDLFMPGPNGIVLLHELQSHTDLSKIPVIIISNSANDITPEMLAPYGVVGIIDKMTMQPNDLAAAVKRAL